MIGVLRGYQETQLHERDFHEWLRERGIDPSALTRAELEWQLAAYVFSRA